MPPGEHGKRAANRLSGDCAQYAIEWFEFTKSISHFLAVKPQRFGYLPSKADVYPAAFLFQTLPQRRKEVNICGLSFRHLAKVPLVVTGDEDAVEGLCQLSAMRLEQTTYLGALIGLGLNDRARMDSRSSNI